MKDLSILARAAMLLLVLLLTTMSAWAYRVTLNFNYDTGPIIDEGDCGAYYTPPSVSRTNYAFCGWSTSSTGPIEHAAGVQISLSGDLTLYAVWGTVSCNVSFYANGGSGTMDAVTQSGGTEYTIPACGFTKDGYIFAGWATSAGGAVVYKPGDKVTLADNLSLYAVWGKEWSGSGTVDNPYQISEVANLLLLAQYVNGGIDYSGKYFKLMNDISYTHTTDWNDATSTENNFIAIGGRFYINKRWRDHPFKGTFDGDGHTISGIRIYKDGSTEGDTQQGLFGCVDNGGTVKNLTLADARITGFEDVGGIVGWNVDGTIENCHVLSNVAIHAVQSGANNHGGIVGTNFSGTVSHCSSAATLSLGSGASGSFYGGIEGLSYGALRDNLAIGVTVPAVNYRGAIAGWCDNLQRNYYSGCTVGTTPTASGIGTANDSYKSGIDVTENDGAVPLLRDAYFSINGNDVTFNRTFPAGKKQTVCLPFAPTALYGLGTVWEFTGISGNKAVMTQRTQAADGALKANTPYIFEATNEVASITFNNVTVSPVNVPQTAPDGQNFIFYGTYGEKTWEADEAVAANIYGFMTQDNDGQVVGQFVKARRRTALRAFSCYLKYSGTGTLTDTDPASKARGITRGDSNELPDVIDIMWVSAPGSTTGIHTADAVVTTQRDGWYSLDGRRLSGKPATKGIYINNGRKVVIK